MTAACSPADMTDPYCSPSHRLRKYNCCRSPPPSADPSDDEYFCLICLDPFTEHERLYEILDCHHTLHRKCAIKWFARNRSCPKCRFEIPDTPTAVKEERRRKSAVEDVADWTPPPTHRPMPAGRAAQRRPVRPTWAADVEAHSCNCCRAEFSFFLRRHHCRRCGAVCCGSCCPKITLLGSDRRCVRCSQ
jgi:hypothetical protein